MDEARVGDRPAAGLRPQRAGGPGEAASSEAYDEIEMEDEGELVPSNGEDQQRYALTYVASQYGDLLGGHQAVDAMSAWLHSANYEYPPLQHPKYSLEEELAENQEGEEGDQGEEGTVVEDIHPLWQLELWRRHNSTMPGQERQKIYATVAGVSENKKYVFIDPGHFPTDLQRFRRKDLNIENVVSYTDVPPEARPSAHDIRAGDVLVLEIESTRSPFGGVWVAPKPRDSAQRLDVVWEEIHRAWSNKEAINGRILNLVNGGYAVGVAGLVGFLPFSMVAPEVSRRVGVLQRFYVEKADPETRRFMLSDPQACKPGIPTRDRERRPVFGFLDNRGGNKSSSGPRYRGPPRSDRL